MKTSLMALLAGLAMTTAMCGGTLLATDSDGAPSTTYNDPADQSRWVTTSSPSLSGLPTYSALTSNGGTFDGHYIYVAPWGNRDPIRRYDTTRDLSSADSWEAHVVDVGDQTDPAFSGTAFDGRYVYFAPGASGDGRVQRLDSLAPFDAPTSWTSFDVTQLGAPKWFYQAIFDGRYLTFVGDPLVRYDTQAPFDAVESWTTFDVSTLDPAAKYLQGVFDGRYLYLSSISRFARYDTAAPIASAPSWAFVTLPKATTDNGDPSGVRPIFDGRYIYVGTATPTGGVERYDTQAPFADSSSWVTLNLQSLLPSSERPVTPFWCLNFDGRFIYLIGQIYTKFINDDTGIDVIVRCDTQSEFDVGACSSVNTLKLSNVQIIDLDTSVFDGRYMYFMEQAGTRIVRFDAKSSPSMPPLPAFHGSFF